MPNSRAGFFAIKSLIKYWDDDPVSSIELARQGAAALSGAHGSVPVWLAALEARAHGLVGNHEGVLLASARAVDARQSMVATEFESVGGLMSFPLAKELYYVSEAHVMLAHDHSQDLQQTTDALDTYLAASPEDWDYSSEAGARCNLALTHARMGDPSAALEVLKPVLESELTTHTRGIYSSVKRVDLALQTLGGNMAKGALDAIREYEPITS